MNDFRIPLSDYGRRSSDPAPVARMMAAFAADFREGVDINLGVGYVNESTIPRDAIQRALQAVLADPLKYRCALNYGGPAGSANLIDSLRRFHLDHQIGGLTAEILDRKRIIVGPNGATGLLESIAHLLPRGIVITSDPIYYIFCNLLERLGFEVLAIPEDEHGMDVDRLDAVLEGLGERRREIRCFYLVTVNNPSCSLLSNDRRRRVLELAARLSREAGRAIPVFFDKAYENLIHDERVAAPESALTYDEDELAYELGTLSKILAPGLRIGFLIGPPGPFLNALIQRTSDAGFSAPLINQEIASYLLDHHVAEQIRFVNAGYREKAKQVRAALEEQLGSVLAEVRGGQAGFYYYLTFADTQTHERSAFFRELTAPGEAPRVMYIPGEHCVHPRGEQVALGRRQLRLSYGYEETPRIAEAIARMAEAAACAAENAADRGAAS